MQTYIKSLKFTKLSHRIITASALNLTELNPRLDKQQTFRTRFVKFLVEK